MINAIEMRKLTNKVLEEKKEDEHAKYAPFLDGIIAKINSAIESKAKAGESSIIPYKTESLLILGDELRAFQYFCHSSILRYYTDLGYNCHKTTPPDGYLRITW